MDLKACLADPFTYPDGNITIKPGQIKAIPTGLAVEIPEGCEYKYAQDQDCHLLQN